MLTKQDYIEIKKNIKEFFEKMTVSIKVEIKPLSEQTLPVDIETENPQILIGERGQTLAEIQWLLKNILRRKIDKVFYLDLDINNYKKKKIEYLKELAYSAADEVALNKEEKILTPMPAYERRIIHLELADRNNITTESIGDEPERKVVIKPYP